MTEGFFIMMEAILVTERQRGCVDSQAEDLRVAFSPAAWMSDCLTSWKKKVALLKKQKRSMFCGLCINKIQSESRNGSCAGTAVVDPE